jgi:hypothetical protein
MRLQQATVAVSLQETYVPAAALKPPVVKI